MIASCCRTSSREDFADVIAEQAAAGFALRVEWFAPHLEFRFPKYGDFAARGVEVELRQALEPWHVMGEEGAAGATVRYVDSSLERLQVKAHGFAPGSLRIDMQRSAHSDAADGHGRRVRRRRALPRLAALHPRCTRRSACTRLSPSISTIRGWAARSGVASTMSCIRGVATIRRSRSMPLSPRAGGSRASSAWGTLLARLSSCRPKRVVEFPFTLDLRRSVKSEAMSERHALTPGSTAETCLSSYGPDPRRYDELLDAAGAMRPHWRPLVERLTGPKAHDAARRALELTRRLIVENGVTYNVYADPQGADRPWALDPLPLVISQDEWRGIEKGVVQRARVLDALLRDLYGPQRLLAEGLVPPELPFGHPNFLWPCHGLVPRGASWLHIYAADIARAPDGRWWLLADRTQSPSGAGYALENRDIVEQVLPEAIRDLGVRRVRAFFGQMRERLRSLYDDSANPLVVILTPGPFNETYFEHAYMARQLGLPLVEGADLTVRDQVVYLKTLGGLKRVHAILRRLDDDFCDPVELRSTSALGVPGLIGAMRAQNVVVSNALGSGVLESAAWLGFLPGIAESLLGESLLLPAVATWWCGEKPALDYVLGHLDRLVIKPAYPNQHFEPVFGSDVTGADRDALVRRLRTRPYAYVAQEHIRTLPGAGVALERHTEFCGARVHHPRLRDCNPGRISRPARRACARRNGKRHGCGVDPARRRQQGHLGAVGWRG